MKATDLPRDSRAVETGDAAVCGDVLAVLRRGQERRGRTRHSSAVDVEMWVTDLWRTSVNYQETSERHNTLTTTGTSTVSPMTIDVVAVVVVVVVVAVVASTFTSLRLAADLSDNTCWLGHAQLSHQTAETTVTGTLRHLQVTRRREPLGTEAAESTQWGNYYAAANFCYGYNSSIFIC